MGVMTSNLQQKSNFGLYMSCFFVVLLNNTSSCVAILKKMNHQQREIKSFLPAYCSELYGKITLQPKPQTSKLKTEMIDPCYDGLVFLELVKRHQYLQPAKHSTGASWISQKG